MRREDLERWLERGNSFGFVKETDDVAYLGWIRLHKLKPHERYLALLNPREERHFVAEQEKIRRRPYLVNVIELRREVHEGEGYEAPEDYRLNETHWFASLDEAEAFLKGYGKQLEEIKWWSELDAP